MFGSPNRFRTFNPLVNTLGFLQQRWPESGIDFCATPETCVCHGMRLETKFLQLKTPVTVGSRFGEWRVCWLGGWTRHQLSYIVMVVRAIDSAE
jgi:hypothetical protein